MYDNVRKVAGITKSFASQWNDEPRRPPTRPLYQCRSLALATRCTIDVRCSASGNRVHRPVGLHRCCHVMRKPRDINTRDACSADASWSEYIVAYRHDRVKHLPNHNNANMKLRRATYLLLALGLSVLVAADPASSSGETLEVPAEPAKPDRASYTTTFLHRASVL